MTKVISFFTFKDDEVLRNHRYYCQMMGYEHMWVESKFLGHHYMRIAYKYNVLLEQLKAQPEGGLLMLLDQHSTVMHPLSLDDMMNGMDSMIITGPTEVNKPEMVFTNMIILRNTPAIRQTLFDILMALHGRLAGQDLPEEEFLLQKLNVMPSNTVFGDTFLNITWRITSWTQTKNFIMNFGAPPAFDEHGRIDHNAVHALGHDANLERLLIKNINEHVINGAPLLQRPDYPAISEDAVSHFNPDSKIALVTLYTHHINTYARVSEHNVKRYCDRHHYAYHVYRGIPAELDPAINGTWVKSWLLKNLIANHEWIIWVDADVIFRNPSIKLEPLLEGRDLLFAKDLCAWPINAGIMGFRNTPENIELLARIWERMVNVKDKSTVYSDQGDQHHTIVELYESNLINEQNILSSLTINTPPQFSLGDNLLTHYVGWGEPYRSIYMAAHDEDSLKY
ncbi:galactosyl transferase GMA12/MNN10 family protein [Hydromonas duriensis]|uniref:Galactosyl transferase GMA12/MNN10 family protein n=1 Tax=Hydromonas duriensis TaxID=1527608 RepID=A0A4R6Y627_9BURK|nr:galactosyl transferase GMA12/MNN10 family protein [Hydromonas duriensis]TDR31004.1 galactosyl transferase GMA12/MNN10 family protein [Hydromonas duriensis]